MFQKLQKWFGRVQRKYSRERCYDEMERRGLAAFDMCGGMMGGDRNTGYLSYVCVDCPYYVSPTKEYIEHDTKCDKCEFQDQCVLLDCTREYDTRRHYIPAIGNDCKKEKMILDKIRSNVCKDCPYYYDEIDQCMYGEPDVPNDMEMRCK